jgi:SNF2 family DNA or RNA helicase
VITSENTLDSDFRNITAESTDFSISDRLLDPVLRIDKVEAKYVASLGAVKRISNTVTFLPCLSLSHNWILDEGRIKPLPFDTPDIVSNALADCDPLDISFPKVLDLFRNGIEEIRVFTTPAVFEKANMLSSEMSLTRQISNLEANLYPYQEHGVAWLLGAMDSFGGAILADEMGLGKTLQIIALFLAKELKPENPALIVCPTTLITNWCREVEKFAPSLTFVVHRGATRTGSYRSLMRSQIVVTTYETLVNDISLMQAVEWSFLICDEAQAVKNPKSQRRIALGRISRTYAIPVTGTPVENSLIDLWSLSDIAIPGLLGSVEQFERFYPDTEKGALELNDVVETMILRRKVADVADDLPDRTDIDLPIELDDFSKEQYEKIRVEAIEEYGAAGRLVAVGQLAIFCAHPWLRNRKIKSENWEEEVELFVEPSHSLFTPKMEICIRLLREAFFSQKKVLIFAAFNHCGDLIREAAESQKTPEAYWNAINGSTPQEERQAIVDQFSNYQGPAVLILNPKAAGTGLNITAATIVIHYTQNWNPALEMQASARAHRRGQELPVTIYRLFYEETVEELMMERSAWKRTLSEIAVPTSSREQRDLEKALSTTPID